MRRSIRNPLSRQRIRTPRGDREHVETLNGGSGDVAVDLAERQLTLAVGGDLLRDRARLDDLAVRLGEFGARCQHAERLTGGGDQLLDADQAGRLVALLLPEREYECARNE